MPKVRGAKGVRQKKALRLHGALLNLSIGVN